MRLDRKTFLLSLAAGGSGVLRGQDRIRGAIIGSGGRGRYLTAQFKEHGVEIAAVCDVYEPNVQAGLQVAGAGAKGCSNYKQLLDDKSIDVVVVASPDHWHAQMTIDAVEAGKDVYVEKPLAHTIADGFRMVEAVRRTGRVVQVGTQRRSFDLFLEARQIMESNATGPVRLVNSWWLNKTPPALGRRELGGKLDWSQWLGPAPKRDIDPVRFFNWYWFWDYSGGLMVGQAAHVMDSIIWFMNAKDPVSVTCTGKLGQAGAEVPETTSMCVEFPDFLAVFTLGYKAMQYALVNDQMKQFHGSQGRFDVGRESYALYMEDPRAVDLKAKIEKRRPGSFDSAAPAHIRNFLDCVRSRKDPNATIEMGQATNIVLCMAVEALRTGARIRYDAAERRMVKMG